MDKMTPREVAMSMDINRGEFIRTDPRSGVLPAKYNGRIPNNPEEFINKLQINPIMPKSPVGSVRFKDVQPKKIRNRNIIKDLIGRYSLISCITPMLERAIPELIHILGTGRVYVNMNNFHMPSRVIMKWTERNTLYKIPGLSTLLDNMAKSVEEELVDYGKVDFRFDSTIGDYGEIIITKNFSIISNFGGERYMIGLDLRKDLQSLYRAYKSHCIATQTKTTKPVFSMVKLDECFRVDRAFSLTQKQLHQIFSPQKRQVCHLINTLKRNNTLGSKYGVKSTSAIMLYGKPGTGKTDMIRSIAYDLQCKYAGNPATFAYIEIPPTVMEDIGRNGNMNVPKHLSQVLGRVQRKFAPGNFSLILFDDCDSWLGNRDELDSSASAESREAMKYNFTMKFMELLSDGIPGQNVVMVFTTNYPEKIDKALLRAGRIDHCVEVTDIPKNLAEEMVKNFDENPEEILTDDMKFPINPAYLQQQILIHKFGVDRVRTNLTVEGTEADDEDA